MDMMSRAYDLRRKFEGDNEALKILDRIVDNYGATMTGTDGELRNKTDREISNRVHGPLDRDPVYIGSQDMAVLEGIENRSISAADYLTAAKKSSPVYAIILEEALRRDGYSTISANRSLDATVPLVPSVSGNGNGHNGHNGHGNGIYAPPTNGRNRNGRRRQTAAELGLNVSVDGTVCRTPEEAVLAGQGFNDRIRKI